MDLTRNVTTVFARVYRNIAETRTNHVVQNVLEVKNVRETRRVLGINVGILAQEFVDKVLNVML